MCLHWLLPEAGKSRRRQDNYASALENRPASSKCEAKYDSRRAEGSSVVRVPPSICRTCMRLPIFSDTDWTRVWQLRSGGAWALRLMSAYQKGELGCNKESCSVHESDMSNEQWSWHGSWTIGTSGKRGSTRYKCRYLEDQLCGVLSDVRPSTSFKLSWLTSSEDAENGCREQIVLLTIVEHATIITSAYIFWCQGSIAF